MTHRTRWIVSPPLTPEASENLVAFPPVLQQILFNRGYSTEVEARAYLTAKTTFDTSPFRMLGMEIAVARIQRAIEDAEVVAIYGDYDVDGVTATALLVQVLSAFGCKVCEYIPNRFEEGYGLNKEALGHLAEEGVKLVISVDCGIRSPDEALFAQGAGLDLIITDHHEPLGEIPAAFAVINPKQREDEYPEKYLAGVGIAYKIAQALFERLTPPENGLQLEDLLDLVALGTVADLAPLTGENRGLVRAGLRQMHRTKRQGLFSLSNVSSVSLSDINTSHIGFALGPRLNAAGRLDSAKAAFRLLLTTDLGEAGLLAQDLDTRNRERQVITRKIQQEAEILALQDDPQASILFAVHPDFNAGVVGLAAARLLESYYRPAIVGQESEQTTRCSCRSIPEFNITEALDRCADLLIRHGGHAAAAGFTVSNENLGELKTRLRQIAREKLGGLDLRKTISADMEIPLTSLRLELLKHLSYLQPTGYGNPEPTFVTRNLQVKSARSVGADAKHLKLVLSDGRDTLDAIGFRMGQHLPELTSRVDVLYSFESNDYNGRTSLQLNLKDIKQAGIPD